MNVGDIRSWERTFTESDVRLFASFSGDEGSHHIQPDALGRLMVHGMLTATMPTKLGGEINFIARELIIRFHRPVFVGDTVRCEVPLVAIQASAHHSRIKSSWNCRNHLGKKVMSGEVR